jgi:subtilase family serine protease
MSTARAPIDSRPDHRRPPGARRRAGLTAALAVIATVTTTVAVSGAAPAAAAQPARATLPGSAPSWTHTRATGTVAAAAPVAIRVYLNPRGGTAALEKAAAAVSTPGSPSYGRFITPAQYRARFEPTAAQVSSIRSWLGSSGFTVTGVEGSRRYVTASGNAAAVRKAFGVSIQTFRYRGATVKGPSADATVPASVAALVSGVDGLDNLRHVMTPHIIGAERTTNTSTGATAPSSTAPPPSGVNNARPCSLFYGQVQASVRSDFVTPLPTYLGTIRSYAVCGYQPAQLRGAYQVNQTPFTGSGVTVGIIDAYAAPTILQDANRYATTHNDPGFAPGQFTQSMPAKFTHAADCGPSGWYGEETLDVEAVHAIATGANVRYYASASCFDPDLLATLDRAIDENKVSVITNSYGNPEASVSTSSVAAYHQAALQAGLQGISLLFSSGDDGDEVANTGLRQADSPASDPAVTAVGGTATAIGRNNNLLWQTGWGTREAFSTGKGWTTTAYLYGAGGGFSSFFNRPGYQVGVVKSATPGRAVPDIAANADPTTGMLVGETQTFPNGVRYGENRVGGTSLASPLTAGMVALALERKGSRLGFLNPALYRAAQKGIFTDVLPVHVGDANVRPDYFNNIDSSEGITYTVRTFGQDSSLSVSKGWDDVTGLGTPNAAFIRTLGK